MHRIELATRTPWVQLVLSEDDVRDSDPELLWSMYLHIAVIRAFEKSLLKLAAEGLVHGPMHSSIGQEAAAVGAALALRSGDAVNGTHRGHHQFLAQGLAHLERHGDRVHRDGALPTAVTTLLHRTYAEILGLADGFSGGRGGSMHLQWLEAGALGTNAIVGGGIPFAAGHAWHQRLVSGDERSPASVTTSYFGDGAMNIGAALESLNLAAAWRLPLCFFVENNIYAVATHIEEVTAETRLSARGQAFGIPSWRVDGMDPVAVHAAMSEARDHMSEGRGPTLIEAETYRFYHQSGTFPGSAFGYRSKDEEALWRKRDPLGLARHHVAAHGAVDEHDLKIAEQTIAQACDNILEDFLVRSSDGRRRSIRDHHWPDPGSVDDHVRSDGGELEGLEHREEDGTDENRERESVVLVEAIARTLARALETDAGVLVVGEDIHRLNGGVNGATRGLAATFPDRVIGSPICENAFVGAAGGLAMAGVHRPIVEFMFADFVWVAADQVFNQIGKVRHMFGGNVTMPLVLRAKVGIGTGYGSQHSMDPAAVFAMAPGWRIVAPSNAYDYVGLMNTALALEDPVLVLEQTELYQHKQEHRLGAADHHLLPGHARVARRGDAVTVLTYLNMVGECVAAAEETGVDAEVIDLRWLDRASLDWDLVAESVRRTHRVLVAEQGSGSTAYGAWLGDELARRFFDHLDHPVVRVAGGEASPTISRRLERAAIARREEVGRALLACAPRAKGDAA